MSAILALVLNVARLLLGGVGWFGQLVYGATRAFAEVAAQEIRNPRKVIPYNENKPLRHKLSASLNRQLGLPPGAKPPSVGAGPTGGAGDS